jgi:hypothetical protein
MIPLVIISMAVLFSVMGYSIGNVHRYAKMRRGYGRRNPVFEIEKRHYASLTFWLIFWWVVALLSAIGLVLLAFQFD